MSRYPQQPQTGGLFDFVGDAVDAVGDALSDIGDAFGDIFDAIPGSQWVKGLVNGPLRDFARSTVGTVVLRAIATSLTGGLAGVVGPQLASVAFALPGVVRGESFDEAFWKEFSWRMQKTAEVLGTDAAKDVMGDALKWASDDLVNRAKAFAPNLSLPDAVTQLINQTGLTPEKLAAELGIRLDVAAAAINLVGRQIRYAMDRYDPKTGTKYKSLVSRPPRDPNAPPPKQKTAAELKAQYDNAVKSGRPAAVITALKTQWQNQQKAETAAAVEKFALGGGLGRPIATLPFGPKPSTTPAPKPTVKANVDQAIKDAANEAPVYATRPPEPDEEPSSSKTLYIVLGIAGAVGVGVAGYFFLRSRR